MAKKTRKERSEPIQQRPSVWGNIISDPLPFIFFGLIIGSKIYALGKNLIHTNFSQLWSLLINATSGAGVYLVPSNTLGRLIYNIVAILFDALIITTYMIRSKPVGKAEGFWERYYPLITVLFPMIGFTYLLYAPFQIGSIFMHFDLPLQLPLMIEFTGLVISLIGASLSIIALWSLKKCFSLMVEVRSLVTTGMYRRIRHPLYMSEIIHALGTCLLFAHPVAFGIFGITLVLEIIRAKFEEHKFLKLVPEYTDFKKRTGFLWPKLF